MSTRDSEIFEARALPAQTYSRGSVRAAPLVRAARKHARAAGKHWGSIPGTFLLNTFAMLAMQHMWLFVWGVTLSINALLPFEMCIGWDLFYNVFMGLVKLVVGLFGTIVNAMLSLPHSLGGIFMDIANVHLSVSVPLGFTHISVNIRPFSWIVGMARPLVDTKPPFEIPVAAIDRALEMLECDRWENLFYAPGLLVRYYIGRFIDAVLYTHWQWTAAAIGVIGAGLVVALYPRIRRWVVPRYAAAALLADAAVAFVARGKRRHFLGAKITRGVTRFTSAAVAANVRHRRRMHAAYTRRAVAITAAGMGAAAAVGGVWGVPLLRILLGWARMNAAEAHTAATLYEQPCLYICMGSVLMFFGVLLLILFGYLTYRDTIHHIVAGTLGLLAAAGLAVLAGLVRVLCSCGLPHRAYVHPPRGRAVLYPFPKPPHLS